MRKSLNNDWELRYEPLNWDKTMAPKVLEQEAGWLKTDLPCDVHEPLIREGLIQEPTIAKNSFESEWIEEKSWWFRKYIDIDQEIYNQEVIELVLDGLDAEADIFINGIYLGPHRSCHYPYVKDVKSAIRIGKNTILVRLTTGYEYINNNDIAGLKGEILYCGGRGDKKRAFIRKPQFVCGWDWAPRILTCGITKGTYLDYYSNTTIKDINIVTKNIETKNIETKNIETQAELGITVELDNTDMISTKDGFINLDISYKGMSIWQGNTEFIARSGINYIHFSPVIKNPQLWWPNGYGDQPLYNLEIWLNDERVECKKLNFGIRTIEINQESIDEANRKFAINVNGVDIFCKGGNWVPSDSIYSRVTDEKYTTLLEEAKDQHFTMLRIWGGGQFEPDIFYQKCDELGILIWHDFMYACSLYPEYEEWFMNESYKEADYQTKRLRNHPSLALWCGNNEMQWIFSEENQIGSDFMKVTCNNIYNKMLPEIIHKNCPSIPYWNSSPYGGPMATSELMGDTHIWSRRYKRDVVLYAHETFDNSRSKFMSEYGFIGPCKRKSIEEYCGESLESIDSENYRYHSHYEDKPYGDNMWHEAIKQYYKDVTTMGVDEYLLYGGLTHGSVLKYSLETFRSQPYCHGALIWMYNDAWGEEGWTTVDYYLRRKIAYYFVKRALTPVKLILKKNKDMIEVTGINDTSHEMSLSVKYGYQSFRGTNKEEKIATINLAKHSRSVVLSFEAQGGNEKEGICYIWPIKNSDVNSEILHEHYFKELTLPVPILKIESFEKDEKDTIVIVSSDTYAHGVHLGMDDDVRLSDDYFDLLPGESKKVRIYQTPQLNKESIILTSVY